MTCAKGAWFDVVETSRKGSEVWANFTLSFTDKGHKAAEEAGLPKQLPAVISEKENYYLAGNFSYSEELPKWYRYAGFAKFWNLLSPTDVSSSRALYWKTYVPVMKKIIVRS